MGEYATIEVDDNAGLQRAVGDAIRAAQASDPLAPVTLVVDTAAQAWALRRQVVTAAAQGTGVANLRAVTLMDWLGTLAERIGLGTPAAADPLLSAAVVESRLQAETGPLAASADHPDTALRLAALADELAWCPLGGEVEALAGHGVSLTAQAAIRFAAEARPALAAALGTTPWPEVSTAVSAALAADAPSVVDLGSVIVVCAWLPGPVRDVLRALADHVPVTRVVVDPERAPLDTRVLDFPDPATEADYAMRLAAEALAGGANPGRVAILYSADVPYARLLERALDTSGIAWHGPTGATLQSTTVARCLFALADLASARHEGSSGITRPLLIRLLGLGHLSDGPAPISSGACRALIRQEGLFGDARNWLGHLGAIGTAHEAEPDDADAAAPRHSRRLVAHALPLAAFIEALDAALDEVAGAATWGDLGARLWSTLSAFHLHGTWWSVRPDDAATTEALRSLLVDGFPTIDDLGAHAPVPSAAAAAEMIDRALTARRGRHGQSSTGIHVGPVSSSRGLVFDRVILVGASEGLLPPLRGDDPLLPDAARLLLRHEADDLPRSLEREDLTSRDVHAVARAAQSTVALLARGALPGRAVGLPSRYLSAERRDRVASTRASLTLEPAPLAPAQIAERAALAGTTEDAVLTPLIASIAAWASPEPGPYFGHLAGAAGPWSLDDRDLSASGIEQYLHCPYHFFVQRILGFSTDEYEDTVDTIAPSDMGTLLHAAFEAFVKQSRADGTLPAPGQPWPPSALDDLRALVDAAVSAAVGKGLTGWRPAWERSYAVMMDALPEFLEVDTTQVRASPPTAPVAAELSFGYEGDPVVDFRVTDDVVVRFRGSIDRLDRSADGTAVAVVDYKSGSSSNFADKLGKPKKDGTPRERQKVQDLVYDVAARALYPEASEVAVHFLFVPNGGKGPEVVTPVHDDDRAEVLRDLLLRLEAAGHTGSFLPMPQGSRDYCPVCRRLGRRAWIVSGKATSDDDGDEDESP